MSTGVITQGYVSFPNEEKGKENVAIPVSATLDFGTMSSSIRINPAIPPSNARPTLSFDSQEMKNAYNNAIPTDNYKKWVIVLSLIIAGLFIALIISISVAVTRGVKIEALDMQISDLEDASNSSSK